jgi:predicted DNA-binding transcriptional regulator AlpA
VASGEGVARTPAYPEDLVTFGQIRATLGVGRARGYQITRDRDFPAPWFVSEDGTVRLWLRADVERWLDRNRPDWRGGTPEGH